ncbi:MAG: hypothetical protein RL001_519 [Pseudomonadota bacterium]|jgi:hypothetical protein|nr:hypothetical protein [Oxalobacteraceae bacterium]
MRLPLIFSFMLAAVAFAHAGQAGLSILRETRDGILYLDRDSIQKKDNIQRAMSTQDFHRVQNLDGHDYLSAKAWYEIDCASKKIRQISLEVFPENMAMGGTLHSKTEAQAWTEADDNSQPGVVWKGVCGKP